MDIQAFVHKRGSWSIEVACTAGDSAHGRQYLRHGYTDFRPMDGLSPPWPFEPEALNSWYELVERRLRLSGRRENSPWVPDSLLAEVREPTEIEQDFLSLLHANYPPSFGTS
jgi:hypothetical protein